MSTHRWLPALVLGFVLSLSSGCGGSNTQRAPQSPSEPAARVTYVPESSFCFHDVVAGQVAFSVYLRNEESRSVDVSVLPVRHYSDGETNRSLLDEIYGEVEPGTVRFVHRYDIEPDHTLVRCEAEITVEGGTRTVDVDVLITR